MVASGFSDMPIHSRTLSRLAGLVRGKAPGAGWVCVGHVEPETQAKIELCGLGAPLDVTHRHAMVALRPFTIAIGLREGEAPARLDRARLSLAVRERQSGTLLGRVRLGPPRAAAQAAGGPAVRPLPPGIHLFGTRGCANYCLPAPRLALLYLFTRWQLACDRDPRNAQKMAAAELFSKWVLFCQPRPVVLVSYAAGGGGNVFPMDLVGPVGPEHFLLGLHQPSPAIAPILESGRLAVSTLPLGFRALAFALGSNHRRAAVDLGELPFATAHSTRFGLPVPQAALAIREVEVEQAAAVGSHLLLVTRTASRQRCARGLQMCHTHGSYQLYLERMGRPLPRSDVPPVPPHAPPVPPHTPGQSRGPAARTAADGA